MKSFARDLDALDALISSDVVDQPVFDRAECTHGRSVRAVVMCHWLLVSGFDPDAIVKAGVSSELVTSSRILVRLPHESLRRRVERIRSSRNRHVIRAAIVLFEEHRDLSENPDAYDLALLILGEALLRM